MSGTYPNSPAPKESELTSAQPSSVFVAESGRRQARNSGGHLWSVNMKYPVMTKDQFEPINSFVMRQDGAQEEFQIILAEKATPRGVATGTPLADGVHSAGATLVFMKGFTPNITDILKAGDVLKFSGHNKVYMCVNDFDSDVSGDTAIAIRPALIQQVAGDESITVNNVPFTMYVDGVHKYKTRHPMLHTYSIRLTESIL